MLRVKLSKRCVSQFKTLVLGGGTAGMAMSWKMARYHKARYVTGMVDAAEQHYYSLVFTIKLRFHEITRFFHTFFHIFFSHSTIKLFTSTLMDDGGRRSQIFRQVRAPNGRES